jgi:diketogulonate reductase-like aldo/keto reductase
MTKQIPSLIYGTAWKESRTAELTKKAVHAGFTAIDTASQKKHYREDFVGDALLELAQEGIRRESLFLQTKFTFQAGQDHRLPYNPSDSFKIQVQSSFTSSLKNLHTDYIDSFLLHGPSTHQGLQDPDWEVWGAIEDLYHSSQVKMIGVSNVDLNQLKMLVENSRVKPMVVQNRCYAELGWDKAVREYCLEKGIVYEGFSLLTANPHVLRSAEVRAISEKFEVTEAQVIFRFAMQIGILPLTGTSNQEHMMQDLKTSHFELSDREVETIMRVSGY